MLLMTRLGEDACASGLVLGSGSALRAGSIRLRLEDLARGARLPRDLDSGPLFRLLLLRARNRGAITVVFLDRYI